jgi:hypothetical protein
VIKMLAGNEFRLRQGFAKQNLVTPHLRRPPEGGIYSVRLFWASARTAGLAASAIRTAIRTAPFPRKSNLTQSIEKVKRKAPNLAI